MSDIEIKMNVLIEEGNANYDVKRFKDAARTFEHLISLAIKNDDPEEAIYFCYRAADCWKKANNSLNRIHIFKETGKLAYTICAKISEEFALKASTEEEKGKVLLIAGESLFFINQKIAKQKLDESQKIFESLVNKTKNDDQKIKYSLMALDAISLCGTKTEIKQMRIKIANLYEKIATVETKKGLPENLQKALRTYEDALKIYENIKSKEKIKTVIETIQKLKKDVESYDPFAT